jgi:hypothetical protein
MGSRGGEGGVIGIGELDLGGGERDPVRERGEVMSVGKMTWGTGGWTSEEEGDGTFDSITS